MTITDWIQKDQSAFSDDRCQLCGNTGYITYKDESGREIAKECSCGYWERRIKGARKEFADIPAAFSSVRLENFVKSVYRNPESQKQIITVAKGVKYWLDNLNKMKNNGIGLYFYSTTKGSGKTRLAASVANELIDKHNQSVKFATSPEIIQEIRRSWDEKTLSESELMHSLKICEILIIDDFGIELDRQWINDKFYEIINDRYVNKRITIYTSNYPPGRLKYDERIINRLEERSLVLHFPEESVRKHIADEHMRDMLDAISEE